VPAVEFVQNNTIITQSKKQQLRTFQVLKKYANSMKIASLFSFSKGSKADAVT